MSVRHVILVLGTLFLAGCLSPVRQDVDGLVCRRAELAMDTAPPEFLEPAKKDTKPQTAKKPATLRERLEVPGDVPGSAAPKLVLPKDFFKLSEKEKEAVLAKFFPAQVDVGPDPQALLGPDGRPLTLADLQKLAREHSPLLRQAASDISAAQGAMVQAAVYNNPTFGYMSSAQSLTNGSIMGPSIAETIVTMGKRRLAEAAAKMDVENAKLAYRRAETDLMASVRSAYFAVLVAREGMRANRGLMNLTDEVYKIFLVQLAKGAVAGYEPAQVSVYAGQARIAYIQARNSYLQSWKNLATAIGLTMMPVTELSGSVTTKLPRFDFEKALAHVLTQHTDALTAANGIPKARFNLRLAEVTAYPDITVGGGFLLDSTIPRTRLVPTLITASVPLPIFDRNQGGIRQAQGALVRALEEPHRVQNALTAAFADAYRRLEENRQVLEFYHRQLLPQQVQAFRAAVLRHFAAGGAEPAPAGVGASTAYLIDVMSSEQNVVGLIGSYLTILGAYWQAASDTASLLQTDDVYALANQVTSLPAADLTELLKLPCCHPCSSLKAAPAAPAEPEPQLLPPPGVLRPASLGLPTGNCTEAAAQGGETQTLACTQACPSLPAVAGTAAVPRPAALPPPAPPPAAVLRTPVGIPDSRIEGAFEGGAR